MILNAFSEISPADQTAIVKQLNARERTARKQLAQIGCDTEVLLFYLWCATNPQLLEGKTSFQVQHAQYRSKIARTKMLVRDMETLWLRLRQAAQDWNIPSGQMANLDSTLGEFIGSLELNCDLSKHKRARYLTFLEPAIQSVRLSYARHTGVVADANVCERITWGGTVPPKYWEWLTILLKACARARGTSSKLSRVSAGAIYKMLSRQRGSTTKALSKIAAAQRGSSSRLKTKSI